MQSKLTICLFILERHNFTLRFLRYFNEKKIPYNLIIGDGSKINCNSKIQNEIKKNNKIKYFKFRNEYNKKTKEYDHNKFYLRILYCLKRVKTKYVKFISDDDMIVNYSTEKCIDFLEKNNDYDGAGGSGLNYILDAKYYGNIKDINYFYSIKNFPSEKITHKVKKFFEKSFDCWHVVFKTKKILNVFKLSSRYNNNDKDFKDHFHELITHILLKIYFFKDPLIFHESHDDPHDGALRGNVLDRIKDKDFLKNLDQFNINVNKIYNFKNKDFIRDQYFKGMIVRNLYNYNSKTYYGISDFINLFKNNIKTKRKKYISLKKFILSCNNSKLIEEANHFQKFLLKF